MDPARQCGLLADHIKLSLLERQRAIALNLEPTSHDGTISRSLESLRLGVEDLSKARVQLGDSPEGEALREKERFLREQYADLEAQFSGHPTSTTSSTISHPNDPSLSADFASASSRPRVASSSSLLKKSLRGNGNNISSTSSKSVRFSDTPLERSGQEEEAARAALFPYRDDPTLPDQSHLDNVQIHQYHKQVIAEQDEALDRLGESIGRQRELSIQIGDELDEHVQMLDEVDRHVDRHQTTLDKARRNLGTFARKARDNKQMTAIVILIFVLVMLIIILK